MYCCRQIKRQFALILTLLFIFTNLVSIVNANDLGVIEASKKSLYSNYALDNTGVQNPLDLLLNNLVSNQLTGSEEGQEGVTTSIDTVNNPQIDTSTQGEQQTVVPSIQLDTNNTLQNTLITPIQNTEVAQPPSVPVNIIATADNVTITVAWDAVPEATGYDVEVDGAVLDNGTDTVYIHEQLISGTQHTYRVRARNLIGTSDWSELLTKTTIMQLAIPNNITTLATGDNIVITWSAVPEASGYDIEADGVVDDNGLNTSYNHTNLAVNTTHSYRVRAKNETQIGEWSTIVTAVVMVQAIDIPQNVNAIPESTGIALSWDSVINSMSYDVEVDGAIVNNIAGSSYSIIGLIPNTPHTIKVRAVAIGIVSEWSIPVSINTLLETPQVTVDTVIDSSVKLSWSPIIGAESYELEVDGVIVNNGAATTYTHSNLLPTTQHTYKVRAKSATNASNWSSLITVRTLPNTPVSGTISQDTVWDITGSPYIIQGDLTINQGVNLQIMPGVIVKIKPGIDIIINGKISALGNETQKIVFTSTYDKSYGGAGVTYGSDYWGAFNIKSTGELDASNVSIRYAGNYYYESNNRGILVEGKLRLIDSDLYAFVYTGIYAVKSSSINVENTSFLYAGVTAISINCTDNAIVSIKNNTIDKCSGIGIYVYQFVAGVFDIQGNNITNGSNYPIYIYIFK